MPLDVTIFAWLISWVLRVTWLGQSSSLSFAKSCSRGGMTVPQVAIWDDFALTIQLATWQSHAKFYLKETQRRKPTFCSQVERESRIFESISPLFQMFLICSPGKEKKLHSTDKNPSFHANCILRSDSRSRSRTRDTGYNLFTFSVLCFPVCNSSQSEKMEPQTTRPDSILPIVCAVSVERANFILHSKMKRLKILFFTQNLKLLSDVCFRW